MQSDLQPTDRDGAKPAGGGAQTFHSPWDLRGAFSSRGAQAGAVSPVPT